MEHRTFSLGIELEMLVERISGSSKNSEDLVRDVLQRVTSPPPAHKKKPRTRGWRNHPNSEDKEWQVGQDPTVSQAREPGEAKRYDAVELISPIFKDGNKDWHKQVEKIIAAVKNRLTIITNETAGYHVHVGLGRGPDARFKLTDLKKIAVVFIVYEKDIDMLHAPHRSIRTNRSLPENIFLLSNRKYAFPRMSKGRIVKRIYRTKNISELQHLVNRIPEQELKDTAKSRPHRYYKVNLLSLDVHRTVEFRQHAGTVNPEKICAWADFVLAVVSAAMSYSEDKLRDLVATGAALVPTFAKQELYDAVRNTAN